jgi:hypothetical protein
MELKKVTHFISPLDPEKIRVEADVHYGDRPGKPESYWYDLPKEYAENISTTGNPWLSCLLPLAMKLGEPLKLCRPVDRVKMKNALELMRVWKLWYPELHIIAIEAPVIEEEPLSTQKNTAAFFSGGVDSFFTVLSHEHLVPGTKPAIDDLIIVWGMDISLKNRNEFQRVRADYQRIAGSMKKNLVDIATNLRETRLESTGWGKLYFGSAFCSCALMLEKRYQHLLFSAGGEDYNSFWRWGSYPFTDHLFSTSQTRFQIDGIGYNRLDRLKYISQFEVVQKNLRVCYVSKTDKNCCDCEKCYRTMLMLELLNCLGKFESFENKRMDYTKLKHSMLNKFPVNEYYQQIQKIALKQGRIDIAENIRLGFKFTTRVEFLLEIAKRLKGKRFFWRFSEPLETQINNKIKLKSL